MAGHTSLVIKNEEVFKKLKEIAFREGKDISELTFEMYEKYIKEHADGNPGYKITQWLDNSDMKAYPAFMRKRSDWQQYIEKLQNEKEITEIVYQAQSILSYGQKKLKYGTTNVIEK